MKSFLFAALALAAVPAALVGCPAPLEPGFTQCGGAVCQPGQYCDAATFCVNGCTSSANCEDGTTCEDISDVTGAGTCSGEGEGEGEGEGDPLANCRAACDAFQECGLAAGETAQCRTDCATLTTQQQTTLGNCRDESCSAINACAGIGCLNDSQCGADEECLNYECL